MKKRTATNRIIVHHSLSDLSTVESIRTWHMVHNGWQDIGYHFVIAIDGEVQSGRAKSLIGAHAFGRNRDSIGVCLVGDLHQHEPTIEQLDALTRLYHQLCRAYSKSLKVEFHRPHIFNLFEPGEYQLFNACPGSMLDRADLLEVVKRSDPYVEA